jgi:hypothetical protein
MSEQPFSRRDLVSLAVALAAGPAVAGTIALQSGTAAPPSGEEPLPWVKRFLHLYAGPDGRSRLETYPLRAAAGPDQDQLLRRTAERVTIGAARAGFGWDFHVANQPTLLVPIFGSTLIGLADGSTHEFGHGDILFAEDCSGQGHTSHAGPQGCLLIQVQLPKAVCPAAGPSDMNGIWRD